MASGADLAQGLALKPVSTVRRHQFGEGQQAEETIRRDVERVVAFQLVVQRAEQVVVQGGGIRTGMGCAQFLRQFLCCRHRSQIVQATARPPPVAAKPPNAVRPIFRF